MKEYTWCNKCKYDSKESNEFPCVECSHNRVVDYYEPQTNADRIRNMSDEELAEWLHNISHDNEAEEPNVCIYDLDKEEEIVLYDSYGDLLEWLQAEVEEGESDAEKV